MEFHSSSSADGSDPQLFFENQVRMLFQDALDSEERKARRVRQEIQKSWQSVRSKSERGSGANLLALLTMYCCCQSSPGASYNKKPPQRLRSWVSCCLTLSWVGNPIRRSFAHAALETKLHQLRLHYQCHLRALCHSATIPLASSLQSKR